MLPSPGLLQAIRNSSRFSPDVATADFVFGEFGWAAGRVVSSSSAAHRSCHAQAMVCGASTWRNLKVHCTAALAGLVPLPPDCIPCLPRF